VDFEDVFESHEAVDSIPYATGKEFMQKLYEVTLDFSVETFRLNLRTWDVRRHGDWDGIDSEEQFEKRFMTNMCTGELRGFYEPRVQVKGFMKEDYSTLIDQWEDFADLEHIFVLTCDDIVITWRRKPGFSG